MPSSAHRPLARAATSISPVALDALDAAWLASLAVVRRRGLSLLLSAVCLLAGGGELLTIAHARLDGAGPAWPLCAGGVLVGLAGLTSLGAMCRAARDLG